MVTLFRILATPLQATLVTVTPAIQDPEVRLVTRQVTRQDTRQVTPRVTRQDTPRVTPRVTRHTPVLTTTPRHQEPRPQLPAVLRIMQVRTDSSTSFCCGSSLTS